MADRRAAAAVALVWGLSLTSDVANAAPGYDQGRHELEWVMARLVEWLPGSWDSYPQVWYERHVRPPSSGGPHEYWYRTFARIEAPQIGDVVFYGQVNVHGPGGPVLAGSQVLYLAAIDEGLGAVNILGQGPADPDRFLDLHERPELWDDVRMRDPEALNCNWLWRRDGNHLFGVLQGKTEDRRKYGPGTCSFISKRTDAEFRADAEWVLTPEQLWLYDNNWSDGMLFLGRPDRTHLRLYRVSPFQCEVQDANGTRKLDAYDRGFSADLEAEDGDAVRMMLLRAEYPAPGEGGLKDRLRLTLAEAADDGELARVDEAPDADQVAISHGTLRVVCQRGGRLPKLHRPD